MKVRHQSRYVPLGLSIGRKKYKIDRIIIRIGAAGFPQPLWCSAAAVVIVAAIVSEETATAAAA
jgi:hypothetical protein